MEGSDEVGLSSFTGMSLDVGFVSADYGKALL